MSPLRYDVPVGRVCTTHVWTVGPSDEGLWSEARRRDLRRGHPESSFPKLESVVPHTWGCGDGTHSVEGVRVIGEGVYPDYYEWGLPPTLLIRFL